jgi:hypothetical protein
LCAVLFRLAGSTGQERTFTLRFLLERVKREVFTCMYIKQVTVYTQCSCTHSYNALGFKLSLAVVQTIDLCVIKQCRRTDLFHFSEEHLVSIFRETELRSNGCRIGFRK